MPLDQHPLAICFKLLQGFGEQGEAVWQLGKDYVERKKAPWTQAQRLAYLKFAIGHLKSKALEQDRWAQLPVDFRTFTESRSYMNKQGVLWPKVIEACIDINSGFYIEAVLTGAIGVAKTTIALYTQAYQVYILSCMKSPHETFDLDPSSEILIVFQSINKNLAQDVDYKRLRDMISNAPYFANFFPYDKTRESDMRFPRNINIKPVSGHDQAAIGQNVIGGILDEVNFMAVVEKSKLTNDGSTYDQAKENYNAIASRRESRFLQLGTLPGMLCLVSSRKYPGQFTDQKEEEAKSNKRIYVYDKRIWDLRPERFAYFAGQASTSLIEQYGEDCPLTFNVFAGDLTRKPRIMDKGEVIEGDDAKLVHWVPMEFYQQFKADLMTGLRNVLGLSTQAMHPYMTDVDKISAAFGKFPSILSRTDCDFVTSRVAIYPKRFKNLQWPRFVHLDLAISRDSAGLAISHVPGFKVCDRGDIKELLPIIAFDALLEIRPPKGKEIDFGEIRALLYKIRSLGLPLKWLTTDSFQSHDMLRVLGQHNFIVGQQSMDVDTAAYDVLKQALYDDRVLAPEHELAQTELVRLELDPKDGHIDHPPNGSKDVSDAMAGSAYGITMRREIWTKHGVSLRNVPASLTGKKPQTTQAVSYKETLRLERGQKHLLDRKMEELNGQGTIIVRDGYKRLRDRVR